MTEVQSRKKTKQIKIKFRHRFPFIYYTFWTLLVTGLICVSGVLWYVDKVLKEAPTITEQQLKSDGTSNMYDINGEIIYSTTEIRRDYIKYEDVPKLYIDMLTSVEDRTFFTEGGVSKKGLFNMFYTTFKSTVLHKGEARGGSTIKQQLVKLTAFDVTKETSTLDKINRKIQEAWLAQQLVENFSKEQIMEFYVNKMFLGENSYGIDTIARTYYGLSIADLSEKTPENISKIAIIAGLGQSPSLYNLYDNADGTENRRNAVLVAARDNGVITEAQYQSALKVPVTDGLQERYWRNNIVLTQRGKYNAYISSTLKQLSDMGYDINKTPLQIYTHLNPEKYEWLTNTINNHQYKDDLQQVAVTVMDTKTGVVLAQSGGRNEEANGLNRATQNTRSSGSGMKPFVGYGPVIEYFGYSSAAKFDTSPYTYPGTNLVANNYGGAVYGTVDMQFALAMSLNTPVNRILDGITGSDYTKQFLSNLGLDVKETYGGSDALGLDVSTEQTASAYAAIANNGMYTKPQYVSKLVFADGSEKNINSDTTQAMTDSTAFILAKMLEHVTDENRSAPKAAIPEFGGYIVKTGTTNYDPALGFTGEIAPDSWVNGATKSIAVSLWTGYDSPNEWGHWIASKETTKYELFTAIMRHYNEGLDTSDFVQPESVIDLGNGFYSPSKETAIVKNPALFTIVDGNGIMDLYNSFDKHKGSEFKVIGSVKKPDIPEGFVPGEWINKLTEDDKAIYDFYRANNKAMVKLDDLVTPETYDSTN